jgi:hypothetical protein
MHSYCIMHRQNPPKSTAGMDAPPIRAKRTTSGGNGNNSGKISRISTTNRRGSDDDNDSSTGDGSTGANAPTGGVNAGVNEGGEELVDTMKV